MACCMRHPLSCSVRFFFWPLFLKFPCDRLIHLARAQWGFFFDWTPCIRMGLSEKQKIKQEHRYSLETFTHHENTYCMRHSRMYIHQSCQAFWCGQKIWKTKCPADYNCEASLVLKCHIVLRQVVITIANLSRDLALDVSLSLLPLKQVRTRTDSEACWTHKTTNNTRTWKRCRTSPFFFFDCFASACSFFSSRRFASSSFFFCKARFSRSSFSFFSCKMRLSCSSFSFFFCKTRFLCSSAS